MSDTVITGGDLVSHLRSRGFAVAAGTPVEKLSGGVSNDVVRIGPYVVKQPRGRLLVADPWFADRRRVVTEGGAMRRAQGIAPAVVDLDEDALVLVMEHVAAPTWKDNLLEGQVDDARAAQAGRALRAIHDADCAGIDGAEAFRQLRLDPYHVATARRHPDLEPVLSGIAARLAATRTHMVHGDYSPKNLLVTRDGLVVIDWEVAHAGDPVFDVAFLLTHLRGKALHRPSLASRYHAAAVAFLDAYGPVDEEWLWRQVGALLLARVDGKSPLEYLDVDARAQGRLEARGLLQGAVWGA